MERNIDALFFPLLTQTNKQTEKKMFTHDDNGVKN